PRQLALQPVVDLGAREAPLAVDLPARQLPAARQLTHLAHVARQVSGHLSDVEGLHRLPLPPCSAFRASISRSYLVAISRSKLRAKGSSKSAYSLGPCRPGSWNPSPPRRSCCCACVCWFRPQMRMNPLAASWSNWSARSYVASCLL